MHLPTRRLTPGLFAAISFIIPANAGVSSLSGMKAHMVTRMKSKDKVTAIPSRKPGRNGRIPALVVSGLLAGGGGREGAAVGGLLPGLVLPERA